MDVNLYSLLSGTIIIIIVILVSQTNAFQAVLTTNGSETYVIFLYETVEYTSPQANNSVSVGRQGMITKLEDDENILYLPSMSNIGIEGVYVARVDQSPQLPQSK